jgi:hypothetical protein
MNQDLFLLLFPIVTLGGWTWHISRKLDEAYQAVSNQNDMIISLVEECKALGSTKVKVTYA